MNDRHERLIGCFQAVFPDLTAEQIVNANSSRVGDWDSVATVTLTATVEEEFGITFDARDIEKLDSFRAFAKHLGESYE